MPVEFKPDVIDASVHNNIEDFFAVKNYGIKGIIHKASEGTGFVDRMFAKRKPLIERAGMLVGSYHFLNRSPPDQQAKHYIRSSLWTPDSNMLLCADWEPYGGNTASLAQCKEFLRIVYEETGQRPVLYSGNLVKEQGRADPFLCQHRLWLAQYAPRYQLPRGWDKYWLWQFGGDSHNHPGIIPGISTRGMDVNLFGGDNIEAEWAGRPQDRREPVPEPAAPVIINTTPPVAAAASGGAAGGADAGASGGIMSKLTSANSTAAAINELSEHGSRLGGLLRKVKQWFWKSTGTVAVTSAAGSQVVDTNKGNAGTISEWAHAHPIAFGCIVGGIAGVLIGGVILYFVVKRCEKWLVTAYNAGRYDPNKG